MARATADVESATTGHERAQEDLKNLLNRGGTTANIGDGSTEPGDPAGTDKAETGDRATAGATGGHGDSLSYGGAGAGSRYGETTGLVGYDIGSGKDPQ